MHIRSIWSALTSCASVVGELVGTAQSAVGVQRRLDGRLILHQRQAAFGLDPRFSPCTGKQARAGTHYRGCGCSHDEVARTRAAVDALVAVAQEQGYGRIEAFAGSIASRINKKLSG
jgi:hypothetical protein